MSTSLSAQIRPPCLRNYALNKSESYPGPGKIGFRVQTLERRKQLIGIGRVEAGAVIPYKVYPLTILFNGADLYACHVLLAGELPRVAEQVIKRDAKQVGVGIDS